MLSSLEMLAAELMGNIQNHGQRLKKITNGLEESEPKKVEDITAAVAQIFDAADEMQQKIESTEQHLGEQAEKVHMQAVLSHTDLLDRRCRTGGRSRRRSSSWRPGSTATRPISRSCSWTSTTSITINSQYGHQGGDVILRQAAGRGQAAHARADMVTRFAGDTYALILRRRRCTMRCRWPTACGRAIERTEFGHGNYPLRLTASVGLAQWQVEEPAEELTPCRVIARAAQGAGGQSVLLARRQDLLPVSSAFKQTDMRTRGTHALVTMFRRKITGEDGEDESAADRCNRTDGRMLTGRSLFMANLQRRLAEWKRGRPAGFGVLLRVDQSQQMTSRFGTSAGRRSCTR